MQRTLKQISVVLLKRQREQRSTPSIAEQMGGKIFDYTFRKNMISSILTGLAQNKLLTDDLDPRSLTSVGREITADQLDAIPRTVFQQKQINSIIKPLLGWNYQMSTCTRGSDVSPSSIRLWASDRGGSMMTQTARVSEA